MALSPQVEESLDEAQAILRNALAFSARNERPLISQAIADLMCSIEKLKSVDKFFDMVENTECKKPDNL